MKQVSQKMPQRPCRRGVGMRKRRAEKRAGKRRED